MAGEDCVRKRQSGSTSKSPESEETQRRPENERSFQNASNGEILSLGLHLWHMVSSKVSFLAHGSCVFALSFQFCFLLVERLPRCSSVCMSCTSPAGLGYLECCPAQLSFGGSVLQCLHSSRVKKVIVTGEMC